MPPHSAVLWYAISSSLLMFVNASDSFFSYLLSCLQQHKDVMATEDHKNHTIDVLIRLVADRPSNTVRSYGIRGRFIHQGKVIVFEFTDTTLYDMRGVYRTMHKRCSDGGMNYLVSFLAKITDVSISPMSARFMRKYLTYL